MPHHDAVNQMRSHRAGEIEHGAEEAALHDVDKARPGELGDARRIAGGKDGSAGIAHERIGQRPGADPKSDLQAFHVPPIRQQPEIDCGLLAHIFGSQGDTSARVALVDPDKEGANALSDRMPPERAIMARCMSPSGVPSSLEEKRRMA